MVYRVGSINKKMSLKSPETNLENIFYKFLSEPMGTLPGIIDEKINERVVNVKVALKKNSILRNGELDSQEYSIIPNVPIFIWSSNEWMSYMPFDVGSPCILLFSKHSIDAYLETDGKSVIDPEDDRIYDPSDAFVLIGLPTPMNVLNDVSGDDFVLGKRDGSALIKITNDNKVKVKASEVQLGSLDASKPVAVAEKVDARLSALENYVIIPHGSPAGPTVPTPFIPGNGGASTGSNKVKVDS